MNSLRRQIIFAACFFSILYSIMLPPVKMSLTQMRENERMAAPVLLQGSQYRKTAAQGSILGRLRLLFFYAVKNLFRRLRVGGYLVAERIERIKDFRVGYI